MLKKTAKNPPFSPPAVRLFYNQATRLNPHLLFAARKYQYGVALCPLPQTFEAYFMKIEASARRNYKKALRSGYEFRKIDYNAHLDDIREIWMSMPIRQGAVPKHMQEGQVWRISDPPSRSPYQAYPYYGVFKDNHLVAYSGCLITGELCSLNTLFGHASHLENGVVPLVLIETVRNLILHFPTVKYFVYDTFYGGSG